MCLSKYEKRFKVDLHWKVAFNVRESLFFLWSKKKLSVTLRILYKESLQSNLDTGTKENLNIFHFQSPFREAVRNGVERGWLVWIENYLIVESGWKYLSAAQISCPEFQPRHNRPTISSRWQGRMVTTIMPRVLVTVSLAARVVTCLYTDQVHVSPLHCVGGGVGGHSSLPFCTPVMYSRQELHQLINKLQVN